MDLFINDLYEVLKVRVKKLTNPKESQNPGDIMIKIKDVRSVVDAIENKCQELVKEQERLREEQEQSKLDE